MDPANPTRSVAAELLIIREAVGVSVPFAAVTKVSFVGSKRRLKPQEFSFPCATISILTKTVFPAIVVVSGTRRVRVPEVGGFMVIPAKPETPPPGLGLNTLTANVPTEAISMACTCAVKFV
jgi:hypothetical protein